MLPERLPANLDPVWREAAAAWGDPGRERALLDWLGRRTPGEWARIDAGRRRSYEGRSGAPHPASGTLANGWRSFSGDGRERERAVASLESDAHELAIGFLLVRCDDWVPAVRLRARTALLARRNVATGDLTRWVPLLLAREGRSRAGGLINAWLGAPSVDLLEALLHNADRPTRRWALTQLLALRPELPLLHRALSETTDPTVAQGLARHIAATVDDEVLCLMLADRRGGVRRAAWLQVLDGRLPNIDLHKGLLDRSVAIRALAQRAARIRGIDAGEVYLELGSGNPAAHRRQLQGLSEWGAPEAVPLALRALDAPNLDVRVAAIEAISARMEAPEPVLLDLLRSRRGPELSATRRGIVSNRIRVPERDLALLRGGGADQRMAAWRLGWARGRWERLLADLLALGDDHDELDEAARADLANWWRRVMPEAGLPPTNLRTAIADAHADAQRRGHPLHGVAWLLRT